MITILPSSRGKKTQQTKRSDILLPRLIWQRFQIQPPPPQLPHPPCKTFLSLKTLHLYPTSWVSPCRVGFVGISDKFGAALTLPPTRSSVMRREWHCESPQLSSGLQHQLEWDAASKGAKKKSPGRSARPATTSPQFDFVTLKPLKHWESCICVTMVSRRCFCETMVGVNVTQSSKSVFALLSLVSKAGDGFHGQHHFRIRLADQHQHLDSKRHLIVFANYFIFKLNNRHLKVASWIHPDLCIGLSS